VRGAVRVAARLGVSPLVIGLTLVGFGTSTPELVTSVQASLAGSPGIAVGNIVGSNIANLLLIFGVSALLCPIAVQSHALRRDGGVMAAATFAFVALTALLPLNRLVGVLFVAALCAYLFWTIRTERVATTDHGAVLDRAEATIELDPGLRPPAAVEPGLKSLLWPLAIAIGGLALVVVGGGFLVDGAVTMARGLGVSETVIGLTIVSVGTSAPELVTSVVAAYRRQSELAFGNVIGSNIYNILGIGGATALIAPTVVPREMVWFDNPVMMLVTIAAVVFAATGLRIGRREGFALLALYVVYVVALVMGVGR
jgi:cation:H+ antiporter